MAGKTEPEPEPQVEGFDWYAEVTDLDTGESWEELLVDRIQPGCFQPPGVPHRCNGRDCDCGCHPPHVCRWCGEVLEDDPPARHRKARGAHPCKTPEFARRIEV